MKNMKKKLFFILPILIFVIVIILFQKNTDDEIDAQFSLVDNNSRQTNDSENEPDVESSMAVVDVKGKVEKPGTYEVNLDKRVDDVLHLAGGLTSDADVFSVNRAEKVYDEMVIIVTGESEESPTVDNSSDPQQVRINHATQEEIETLNGIGPSKAQAIFQYREENGPFQTEEDLLEISGIGEKTLESFKDDILIP